MAANENVQYANSVSLPAFKAFFDNEPLKTYPCVDKEGKVKKHQNGATIRRFQIGSLPQQDAEGNPLKDENGLPICKPFIGAVSATLSAVLDKGERPSADALQVCLVRQLNGDGTWSDAVPTLCFSNKQEADNEW